MLKFLLSTLIFPFFLYFRQLVFPKRFSFLFYFFVCVFLVASISFFYAGLLQQARPFFLFHLKYSGPLAKHISSVCHGEQAALGALMAKYNYADFSSSQTPWFKYFGIAVAVVTAFYGGYLLYSYFKGSGQLPPPPHQTAAESEAAYVRQQLEASSDSALTPAQESLVNRSMELPNPRHAIFFRDHKMGVVGWSEFHFGSPVYLYRSFAELFSFPRKKDYLYMIDPWQSVVCVTGFVKHTLAYFERRAQQSSWTPPNVYTYSTNRFTSTWWINKTYPPYGSNTSLSTNLPLSVSSSPSFFSWIAFFEDAAAYIAVCAFAIFLNAFMGYFDPALIVDPVVNVNPALPTVEPVQQLAKQPIFVDFASRVTQQYMSLQPTFSFEALKDCFSFKGTWAEYVSSKSEVGRQFVEDYRRFRPYLANPDGPEKLVEALREAKTKQKL